MTIINTISSAASMFIQPIQTCIVTGESVYLNPEDENWMIVRHTKKKSNSTNTHFLFRRLSFILASYTTGRRNSNTRCCNAQQYPFLNKLKKGSTACKRLVSKPFEIQYGQQQSLHDQNGVAAKCSNTPKKTEQKKSLNNWKNACSQISLTCLNWNISLTFKPKNINTVY